MSLAKNTQIKNKVQEIHNKQNEATNETTK
jgi:hypothetical protein